MLFFSRLLVEFFQTSAFNPPPEDLLSRNFHLEVESVKTFGQRVSILAANESQSEFLNILLLGLMDTKVGLYSKFHDLAGELC